MGVRSLSAKRSAQRPVSPVGEGIELRRLLLLHSKNSPESVELQLKPVTTTSIFLVVSVLPVLWSCVSWQLLSYFTVYLVAWVMTTMTTTPTHPGFPNILSDNVHEDYVLVTCGSTVGKLFFNKLKNCTGKLGSVSCILKADNSWCSPSELESLGGKAKSKNWKRSICLDGKPLLHCFVHLGLSDPGRAAEPLLQSQPPSLPDKQLINPVLAFVKAFRLKGDNTSLKSAIATRFDTGVLSSAIKALWDFSGPDLSRLGLTYQSRRNADKQQLFESIFADLVSAFETLDADDVLPDIYCEAIDLLSLSSLELDPVSKRLETNTKVLQSLCTSVESLPPKLVKPIQDQASSEL